MDDFQAEHAGQVQPAEPTPAQAREESIVKEVIDALSFVKSYEDAQRRAEDEENEFEAVDQWLPAHRSSRAEHIDEATGRKVAARPTLTANLLDQHLNQVVSEARQARLALTVKPKAGLANTKTAGYFKGLIRGIQVESGALEVRLWAMERAARVGRGAYLIRADYANDGDFDVDLIIERILDQDTVYWDPYRQQADNADAEWALITDWVSEEKRMEKWPNKPILVPEGAFENDDHEWFAADPVNPKHRRVRIATFYKVIHHQDILAYHPQTGPKLLSELPPEIQEAIKRKADGTRTRPVDRREVRIYTIDGSQVLEEHPWHGRYIPIMGTIGKEYFVKGKRRFKGAIANAMDIQRAINVLISSATELAGTMPRAPYLMAAGQDEGFEEEWDDAPVKNYTRLHYNVVDLEGKPVGPPQRQVIELQVQGLMYLLRMLLDLFHGVTGNVSPSMRAVNPYDRSGKAIEALQRQGSAGTSNYLDNLATITMPYEGKVLVNAIPQYYDRPGRILRVMGEENDDETAIMLKVPFVRDQDGNPVPVPCQQCQGQGQVGGSTWNPFAAPQTCPTCQGAGQATRENMPEEYDGQTVEYVDFADGEYKVQAVIDRSFQTKQEEALAGMSELAKAAPNLVPAYAAAWVRAMGFSGSMQVADNLEAAFPVPKKMAGQEKVPPAFLAQFQALQQQHEQALAALEQAQKVIEGDQLKAATEKELATIKAAATERLEQIKQQGKILALGQERQADAALEQIRGEIQRMQQEAEHRHEILIQLLKEKGAKETERHSVALHDAAAERAAERARLNPENNGGDQ